VSAEIYAKISVSSKKNWITHCETNYFPRYVRHLLTHNIKYVESIHGYREKADMRTLMAESVRNPTHDSSNVSQSQTSERINDNLVLAPPPPRLPDPVERETQQLLYPNDTMNSSNLEQWNRPNIQPYSY
jgi:hypothetical protein